MRSKIIFLSTAVLLGFGAFAQSEGSVTKPGIVITGGVNLTNVNGKSANGNELDNNLKTGFNGGVNVALPLWNGFYLQPGIEYRQKGSKLSNGNNLRLSYIEMPVSFIYKPVLKANGLLIGFGPYVGLGIDGKVKSADGTRNVSFDNDYSASQAEDIQFKKWDAGTNFMVGYEFKGKMSVGLSAQLGLVDINPDTKISDDHTSYRNTGFGLSMGYKL